MTKKSESVVLNRYIIQPVWTEETDMASWTDIISDPKTEFALCDLDHINEHFYGTEYECLVELVRRHPEDNYLRRCFKKYTKKNLQTL